VEECRPCPFFASFTLAFALQLGKKARKNLSQVKKNLSQFKKNLMTEISWALWQSEERFHRRNVLKSTAVKHCARSDGEKK
jgi:hypothetical protein